MYWENPSILWVLWILPLLAGVLYHAHRRRMAAARSFLDEVMVKRLVPALGGRGRGSKASSSSPASR